MSDYPDALWLSVSPGAQCFDRPLLHYLAKHLLVAEWEYRQTQDEPNSFDVAMVLLHDYLKHSDRPIHLLGHGTSGLLALLYARRHPERVRSLTLLAVGANPAVDWQAHYYGHRQLLPCSGQRILTQMVHHLFGYQSAPIARALNRILQHDLDHALSPYTLFHRISIVPDSVSVPLLVCGSDDDMVVDPCQLRGWQPWLGKRDRQWLCPSGRHFFHYFHPQKVGDQTLSFWASLQPSLQPSSLNLDNTKSMESMGTI